MPSGIADGYSCLYNMHGGNNTENHEKTRDDELYWETLSFNIRYSSFQRSHKAHKLGTNTFKCLGAFSNKCGSNTYQWGNANKCQKDDTDQTAPQFKNGCRFW